MRVPTEGAFARWVAAAALWLALTTGTASAESDVAAGREANVRSPSGLNVRVEPSADAGIVTTAEDGDFVHVLDVPAGEWVKIEYDGTVGWVAAKYLGPARDRATVSTRGNRRATPSDEGIRLLVPYRSQLDGTAYSSANCGPASIAMVLEAFGKYVPTTDIRRAANRIQGTTGMYDTGTALEALTEIVSQHGLVPRGLFADGKYDQWSMDDVRQALRNGHVVIPQVHLATLPGQEHSNRGVDHFIAIIGYEGDQFIYHDPAFNGNRGHSLRMSEQLLKLAWKRGDFPFAGFSVGPGPGMEPLVEPIQVPVQVVSAAPPLPAIAAAVPTPDRRGSELAVKKLLEAEDSIRHTRPAAAVPVIVLSPPVEAVSEQIVAIETGTTDSRSTGAPSGRPLAWIAMAAALGLAVLGSRRTALQRV